MSGPLYTLSAFKAAYATAHLLPRAWCQWLGAAIARASYSRRAGSQAALHANLQLVTGLAGAELDKLCRSNVTHFGRMLADYFLCSGMDAAEQAQALIDDWSGLENLTAARERGKGAIIVTGHLGHWELGAVALARRGFPLTVVTLDEPSTGLTRWREACRRHLGIKTIAVGPGHPFAFVEMIHALRRNEMIAMLVDRPYAGTGASVQFFGHATEFSTAPALLAQPTGAAVLPAFVLQKPNGHYVSFADPLIPMITGDDSRTALAENTQRVATIFEATIRHHPEQWFNYVPIWNLPSPA